MLETGPVPGPYWNFTAVASKVWQNCVLVFGNYLYGVASMTSSNHLAMTHQKL